MSASLSTLTNAITPSSTRPVARPELLLPAGDPEKMRYAIAYGADAVYLGLPVASLRTVHSKDPFTPANFAENIRYAHERNVKTYATLNIFANNRDLDRIAPHIEALAAAQVDAVILSDAGLFRLVRQVAPDLPIHISTQANTLNVGACAFWQDLGVPRVILAREVPLRDMAEIAEALPGLELECFVHGSLCVAYSGRCVISDYLTDNTKNSNKGMCGNSCRWEFDTETGIKSLDVKEASRPDAQYTLEEDDKGSYLLNSKDLCLVRYLAELRDAGIVSFKAEGRTKGVHYVATIGQVYREAIDAFAQETPPNAIQIRAWEDQLQTAAHRGYTEGFLFGKPGESGYNYQTAQSHAEMSFVANATGERDENGRIEIIGRNPFPANAMFSMLTPAGDVTFKADELSNQQGLRVDKGNPNQALWLALPDDSPLHALPAETLQWGLLRMQPVHSNNEAS